MIEKYETIVVPITTGEGAPKAIEWHLNEIVKYHDEGDYARGDDRWKRFKKFESITFNPVNTFALGPHYLLIVSHHIETI